MKCNVLHELDRIHLPHKKNSALNMTETSQILGRKCHVALTPVAVLDLCCSYSVSYVIFCVEIPNVRYILKQ